jgi:hypothetical protein
LGVDPEEQLPGVIPGPIQPNERVFTGTLTTKPSPQSLKNPWGKKCEGRRYEERNMGINDQE